MDVSLWIANYVLKASSRDWAVNIHKAGELFRDAQKQECSKLMQQGQR